MRRIHPVLLLLSLLTACAPIGVSTPQTFDERLASGIATVSAVRTTTTTLYREGLITPDDAQRIQAQATDARESLDVVEQVHATDPAAGNAQLTQVTTNLQGLQTYLNTRRPLPCAPFTC